ncbi:MAG: zf-HC2 domain-containing protein [Acidobacteriia bacterium]|nr:zf-HC2 domain-containing protein [Terriglobia bacterium]
MKDCKAVREQLALLLYGELSFDEEERIESHLDACVDCRAALKREKELHAAFDQYEATPSPSLLRDCREDLAIRLMEEAAVPRPAHDGWWDRLIDALTWRPTGALMRPVGALTLMAIGFGAARMLPASLSANAQFAGLVPGAARVRYVEPASDGKIQIVLDETRQRIVSGRLDDQQIKTLLLTAAKDPSDPGLRAETVDILNTRAQSADVRDALIYSVQRDQNAGVRMKALDGLKPYAQEPEVRAALTQVLLKDSNPGLRTQAIDLLTKGSSVDRQVIGTLQELMLRGEQQGYVRERCRRVLEAMNASLETY